MQRRELETMRLELLHKEFMMLTPFRTDRNAKMLDITCVYNLLFGLLLLLMVSVYTHV